MPTPGGGTVATAPPQSMRRGGAFINESMTVDKDKLLDNLAELIDAIDKMGVRKPTDEESQSEKKQ